MLPMGILLTSSLYTVAAVSNPAVRSSRSAKSKLANLQIFGKMMNLRNIIHANISGNSVCVSASMMYLSIHLLVFLFIKYIHAYCRVLKLSNLEAELIQDPAHRHACMGQTCGSYGKIFPHPHLEESVSNLTISNILCHLEACFDLSNTDVYMPATELCDTTHDPNQDIHTSLHG